MFIYSQNKFHDALKSVKAPTININKIQNKLVDLFLQQNVDIFRCYYFLYTLFNDQEKVSLEIWKQKKIQEL